MPRLPRPATQHRCSEYLERAFGYWLQNIILCLNNYDICIKYYVLYTLIKNY
nr:MAG TPA: hypothetical protein [Caudoviricetes sp.]